MNFRTQYTHDRAISALFATVNNEESMTQQSDAAETDINVIMKRYNSTGQLPQVQLEPMYADFTGVTDYRDALDMIRAADAAFAGVPANIRKEFDNNPARFIEFVQDPKNQEKIYEMGLAKKPEKVILQTPTTTETNNGNGTQNGTNST